MSLFNQPCAKLVLRMIDLPTLTTTTQTYNTVGSAINGRQQCSWTAIDMRAVIGSMYDKYDKFNIVLTSITSAAGNTSIGSTSDDRICTVYMSGLPWQNCGYDSASKTVSSMVQVGSVYLTPTVGSSVPGTIFANPCTFGKDDGMKEIYISLYRMVDNTPCVRGSSGSFDYQFIFTFSIFGVKN